MAVFTLVLSLLSVNIGTVFYVQTNQPGGNEIAVFHRSADGALAFSGTVSTCRFGLP
jgi:hypothetical protein